ncbi:MarR family transcriptional regulator [Rhodophyticola sp. CCM32]|uniref:MarR family winged helix-turn-helix transcriptional regulator n=1 Tax=Rhodophyticola sp. CCM32 TaxID=2916397 RepID=UPI00107EFE49|nr:MarR family transcriptional regulator [Rhodophyticola sp. CCM32]QBX99447.1 MarR family transcriptional regulator [Rhodophyticola sp. CCM32]
MTQNDRFDLQDFLPYLLTQAAEVSSLEFQREYKDRYGMLRMEWRVLFHLGRYGAMTATEICRRSRIHKTKTSRAVAALERKRYLSRRIMDTDRRQERLSLTRAGESVFADLLAAAQQFDQAMTAEFTPDEEAVLRQCLTRIARIS